MTAPEKLRLLLRLSELTQAELALKLGVTFAAFNRWINAKAKPRAKALARIDELYRELSGERRIPETVLEAKREEIARRQRLHPRVLQEIIKNPDILDRFFLSLTYNSNRIEGSTLSEDETAAILFQNAALPDKSIVEQMEAKNHRAALEYLLRHVQDKKKMNEHFILKLHSILMNAIRMDAGAYRNHRVRIMGTHVPTANHLKIPALMRTLVREIGRKSRHATAHIAEIHGRLEKIHPFADGNGRVGRLLMHAMALKENLAPVVVLQEKRRAYMNALNKAQMKDDVSSLEDFVCDAITEGYLIVERE